MDRDLIKAVYLIVFVTIGLLIGSALVSSASCRLSYPKNLAPHYSILTGCTIQTSAGRIPARNYRVL